MTSEPLQPDLIERLQRTEKPNECVVRYFPPDKLYINPDGPEAATAILTLQAQLELDRLLIEGQHETIAELAARLERRTEALTTIADRPGAGTDYAKGVGEWPIGEAEHMALIAREALAAPQGGV